VRKALIRPSVSILISAHNEAKNIENKIRNCLDLDYPKDKVELLIGSDGSTDATDSILDRYNGRGIKAYRVTPQSGKANMLNFLAAKAAGEIIVFADARQQFEKKALAELVKNFADGNIGCVSGELRLRNMKDNMFSKGLKVYWDYELFIRRLESSLYSMTGATGAIYAIRRRLFTRLPENMILDDVYIPLKIVEQGYRAVFEPAAVAWDEPSVDRKKESGRKVRTLAGNWQIFKECAKMFNPFKSPVAVQLFSHKLLRVIMPWFLVTAFLSNALLCGTDAFRPLFAGQLLFYILAALGPSLSALRVKGLTLPYAFCRLNIDAIFGTIAYFTGAQKAAWGK
jgi:cellulose synthase/poly-beta-1,6-N-acetylglucosamine synthase-like glycosyltransferase